MSLPYGVKHYLGGSSLKTEIIKALLVQPQKCQELVENLGCSKNELMSILRKLKDKGILSTQRIVNSSVNRWQIDDKFYSELTELVKEE
mgnify:CR=1 FL=1